MNQIWDIEDNTAKARQTDPETSHEAAASIKPASITEMKERILEALREPRTDQELIAYFSEWEYPGTPSGIRSRRSELEKVGLVKVVGYGHTDSGKRCRVFQVVR